MTDFLRPSMRDLLIEHLGGRVVPVITSDGIRYNRTKGAIRAGWLRPDRLQWPRSTTLTPKGEALLRREIEGWGVAMARAKIIPSCLLSLP